MERDHPGKRFSLFNTWLTNTIAMVSPDLIVYERIVGGRHAGGNTTLIQKGLEAVVQLRAFRSCAQLDYRPIPTWTFAAGTIKKWATGSGLLTTESKKAMCKLAFDTFKDQEWVETSKGVDDNQADALWILSLTDAVIDHLDPETQDWEIGHVSEEALTPAANVVTATKWADNK